MKYLFFLFPILLTILAACTSTSVDMPLAEDQPTFIFFYTDG